MQVTSNGKVRRSEPEWRDIFERWEQSGLSRGAFAGRNKPRRRDSTKWKRRLSVVAEPVGNSFVELTAPGPPPATVSSVFSGELEVVFPSGVVLRWKA